MRRIWILTILVGISTALFLAYLYVPPVKAWLTNIGIVSAVSGFTTGISDIVNGKMHVTSVIPLLGTMLTVSAGVIKRLIDNARNTRANAQIQLSDAQSTIGNVKIMAKDAVDAITGEKDSLKNELSTLQQKYTTDITKLEDAVKDRDGKLYAVQQQLGKAQRELIGVQAELKETATQRDEYRIALAREEKPTLH